MVDFSFLLDQVGKPYDMPQAIGSAIDFILDNVEDFSKLYCSELVAMAYEKIHLIPEINASEQTPINVCDFNIFNKPNQLKGSLTELRR